MKNINEQINRMKSLFSEERLFGNLVEQENGELDKCISGDCENGKGTKDYKSNPKGEYTGEFKNGKRDGKGTWKWEDGDYYIGTFKNDTFDGEGIWYEKNGDIYYKGGFKNNQFYGKGQLKTETGYVETYGDDSMNIENTSKEKNIFIFKDKVKEIMRNLFGKNGELSKNETGCKRVMNKYVRLFEKDPDYLNDVIKKKDEENSVYKYVNYCNTKFGFQYSGDKNIIRFLRKLGIEPKFDLPEKTDKKTSLPIVDENGNKWGTLKREKTFEYSITGEEGVGIIVKGGINTDELFTDSLYDDLISFNSDYKDYDIDDILNKMTIISKDDKSKRQSIRFRIDI